jgi:hypothetical protein
MIGRLDYKQDYLEDMVAAHMSGDVMGVGFNIPQAHVPKVHVYAAPVGEYKPEVRLGLFDLSRFARTLPWPNILDDGKLRLGWYHSLHALLGQRSLRCLRGGDSRTFYVHPLNMAKSMPGLIDQARSKIESGLVPDEQVNHWDLVAEPSVWKPPVRFEEVVFIVLGRNTPRSKVARCFNSLKAQTNQNFGVIVIDDASDPVAASVLAPCLGFLSGRLTLIHNTERLGRVQNKWNAVHDLIDSPSTLLVVLDMDDALISRDVVSQLYAAKARGAELIVGGVFRPDKPLKLYPTDFSQAASNRGAGNVWCHLRAFTKAAYLTLSKDDLQMNGQWLDSVSDYLTMVPMSRRTHHHETLDGFCYLHERTTPSSREKREKDNAVIDWVLARNRK